jgi:proteasome lid subunit RPN8/RPN11
MVKKQDSDELKENEEFDNGGLDNEELSLFDTIEVYLAERLTTVPVEHLKISIEPKAIAEMLIHAERFYERKGPKFLNREVMGLLIGVNMGKNKIHINRVEAVAEGSPIEVQFKEEHYHVYEKLNLRKDLEYVVGWYHSHPGIGLFLSVTDLITHATSFQLKNPQALAIVLDPSSIPRDINYNEIKDFSEILGVFQIESLTPFREETEDELHSYLAYEAKYYRLPWKKEHRDF